MLRLLLCLLFITAFADLTDVKDDTSDYKAGEEMSSEDAIEEIAAAEAKKTPKKVVPKKSPPKKVDKKPPPKKVDKKSPPKKVDKKPPPKKVDKKPPPKKVHKKPPPKKVHKVLHTSPKSTKKVFLKKTTTGKTSPIIFKHQSKDLHHFESPSKARHIMAVRNSRIKFSFLIKNAYNIKCVVWYKYSPGTKVSLMIKPKDMPRYSIWSYKSKNIYSLQIDSVKPSDSGYYRALIMYNNGLSKTDLYYKLSVTQKPSDNLNKLQLRGSDIVFRTNKPTGSHVTWYRVSGSNRIKITESSGPKYFILQQQQKLVVADVGPEDIGTYMALISDKSNSILTRVYFKATKLDYHRQATKVKAKEYYTVKLSFSLPRTAISKLKSITWYHTRPYLQISSSKGKYPKYTIAKNKMALTINKLDVSDAGYYVAVIEFKNYKTEALFYVTVEKLPVKPLIPKKLSLTWGQGAILSFKVPKGVIVSKVEWTYYKVAGGTTRIISTDKRTTFTKQDDNYSLHLAWCRSNDAGFYKAVVTTDANEELPVLYQIIVKGEPPVVKPEVVVSHLGDKVTMTIEFKNPRKIKHVQWSHLNPSKPVIASKRIVFSKSSNGLRRSVLINDIQQGDAGFYEVKVLLVDGYTARSLFLIKVKGDEAHVLLQSPAAAFTVTGIPNGSPGTKDTPIRADKSVGQQIVIAGYLKNVHVKVAKWYRVLGSGKRQEIKPSKKYEIVRKANYVFLVIKSATKSDRGQYILQVTTKTSKVLVAYYVLKINGDIPLKTVHTFKSPLNHHLDIFFESKKHITSATFYRLNPLTTIKSDGKKYKVKNMKLRVNDIDWDDEGYYKADIVVDGKKHTKYFQIVVTGVIPDTVDFEPINQAEKIQAIAGSKIALNFELMYGKNIKSIQWFKFDPRTRKSTPIKPSGRLAIKTKGTKSSLLIARVRFVDAGYYRVLVKYMGRMTDGLFNVIVKHEPKLVNPCSTHKGGTVVFSVHEPSSTIITKISWYRIIDDVPHALKSSKKYAITDRHRQLTISGVTKHDIGMYQAVLTTHEGETKDEYFAIRKEDVEPPMRIIEATEYWTVTLSFQYSLVPGDKVKSITWKHLSKGGTEIKTSSGKYKKYSITKDRKSLTITKLKPKLDSGCYVAIVNLGDYTLRALFKINIKPIPPIKAKVHESKVKWGQNVIFSFESPKTVEIKKIEWTYKKGNKVKPILADGKKIILKKSGRKYFLHVNWVATKDEGYYNCLVHTADGEKLPVSFHLIVLGSKPAEIPRVIETFMHDTVTMGFEFDHRSPVKTATWYHMVGHKKNKITNGKKYIMKSPSNNKFKRTMDLVYVTAKDKGLYVVEVELVDGYKTRAIFDIKIVGDKLRNIILKPYSKTSANTKPKHPITYPHEAAIFLGTPEDPQIVIARLGATAHLVFKLDNVSPDKIYWYYINSKGTKSVIAESSDMKKYKITNSKKYNAYRLQDKTAGSKTYYYFLSVNHLKNGDEGMYYARLTDSAQSLKLYFKLDVIGTWNQGIQYTLANTHLWHDVTLGIKDPSKFVKCQLTGVKWYRLHPLQQLARSKKHSFGKNELSLTIKYTDWTDAGYYKAVVTIDGAYDFAVIFLVRVQGEISTDNVNMPTRVLALDKEAFWIH